MPSISNFSHQHILYNITTVFYYVVHLLCIVHYLLIHQPPHRRRYINVVKAEVFIIVCYQPHGLDFGSVNFSRLINCLIMIHIDIN